jgi:hypothetical protein
MLFSMLDSALQNEWRHRSTSEKVVCATARKPAFKKNLKGTTEKSMRIKYCVMQAHNFPIRLYFKIANLINRTKGNN